MAPLIVLVVVTLCARLAGEFGVARLRQWTAATRVGFALMFCFTAVAHFNSMRPDIIRMVPAFVPNAGFMVTFTGICEVLGGIGLLPRRTRRVAAVALILLLIAVLPANINAAISGSTLGGATATPLIPRIALQGLFVVLLWWAGIRASERLVPKGTIQSVSA
jgi:uncharacterized membrane protein